MARKDFANEEEFLKWKSWSDGDYQVGEQAGQSFYDNTILHASRNRERCPPLKICGAVKRIRRHRLPDKPEIFKIIGKHSNYIYNHCCKC
ncbi:hypothetical protein OBV_30880 [Oscillibacter valericigenes Sjm18-20]|nr:hypothetical protein OBV_30880 [Oscillibacter valericigenes Sjm18-20]